MLYYLSVLLYLEALVTTIGSGYPILIEYMMSSDSNNHSNGDDDDDNYKG